MRRLDGVLECCGYGKRGWDPKRDRVHYRNWDWDREEQQRDWSDGSDGLGKAIAGSSATQRL